MSVSIIVPIYNEINYLEIFIERLISNFKNEDVQYIFVNDGSDDGSTEWLSKNLHTLQINNYQYINLSKNKGKGYALRKGLQLVTCEYVLFIDSDMEYDSRDGLEMYFIIKNNPKIDVLFGSRYLTGKLIRSPIKNIRIAGRTTQGVTLFKVEKDEKVLSVAAIKDLNLSDEQTN